MTRLGQALGVLTRDDAGSAPLPGVVPPDRSKTAAATLRQALTLDSVFRAMLLLQTSAQQLTLDVWRRSELIDTPSLVRKPNVESSQSAFLAETVNSLAGRGNAYWRKHRGADGTVLNLSVLPALDVTPMKHPRSGRISYHYRGKELPASEIQHLKLLRITGEAEGLGPIQSFSQGLGGALDQARYSQRWFTDSGVPNGVLATDQQLTAQQAEEYKRRWMEQRRKDNGPAVLGSGLDYRLLQLKPAEAQWLETQKFSVTQIARLFGIPAHMMLAAVEGGSNLTYTNQEQADIQFVRFTLMAYLREIEEAFTDLLPHGQSARFNVEGLLRTDTKTRYEAHKIAIDAGFLLPEEARAIEGLPPAPRPLPAKDNANA